MRVERGSVGGLGQIRHSIDIGEGDVWFQSALARFGKTQSLGLGQVTSEYLCVSDTSN